MAAALIALLAWTSIFADTAVAVPPDTEITIAGGGWGHGIGMPQYAARGMAEDGATHAEILAQFYTGTGLQQIVDTNGATIPETIRVGTPFVAGETRPFLWLDFEALGGSVEACLPGEAPGSCSFTLEPGETWRIAWNEPTAQCRLLREGSIVHQSPGCGFRLEWSDQPGTKVSIPEVGRILARGAIEFVGPVTYNQRGFHTVVELTLEEYLYGLAEMPVSWPSASLEAQVIAARTFAAETTRRRVFVYAWNGGFRPDCSCHLVWSTYDQSYRGWHTLNEGNATHGADWRTAVDTTAGSVVVHPAGSSTMAETYYFSSSGGATENVWDVWGSSPTKYSYLASVSDPWSERYADETSTIRWSKTMTASAVAEALSFDRIGSVEILARYVSGSPSDVEVTGQVDGVATTRHYTGSELKSLLGLRSHHIYSIDGFDQPDRVAGADRYETAVAAAQRSHPDGAEIVYLAVGTNFPDALAAGPAAAAEDAPILLAQAGALPGPTASELQRLDPATVVVLGGPAAISAAVVDQVEVAVPGASIVRRWGADRYATAVAITEAAFSPGVATLYVATGEAFPDALVAAPAAIAVGAPLLLVRSGTVPAVVWDEIGRLAPSRIVIVGGTGAVSGAVASQLRSVATLDRLAAPDRYAVSALVSSVGYPSGSDVVYVAVGDDFPDALAAGPVTASGPGPPLLVRTTSLPGAVVSELDRLDPSEIVIFGGPAAVSEDVAVMLAAYQG